MALINKIRVDSYRIKSQTSSMLELRTIRNDIKEEITLTHKQISFRRTPHNSKNPEGCFYFVGYSVEEFLFEEDLLGKGEYQGKPYEFYLDEKNIQKLKKIYHNWSKATKKT